jgi:hypothetical protein
MFNSLAEWVVLVGLVGGVYLLLRPLQRRLERRITRWFIEHSDNKGRAPIIDITPIKKKAEKESKDYEN